MEIDAPEDFKFKLKVREDSPFRDTTFPWKYNEGKILKELEIYLKKTYGEHYVSGGPQGVQEFDVMEADGELGVFSKQSARKYLRRYGKKDGCNRKDLLKVLHYTIILLYLNDKELLSGNQDCEGRTSKA